MDFFQSELAPRLIFILAIINLVSGVLIFLSCRCIPGLRISGQIMKITAYARFYKIHCYIWWVFWISVLAHAVIAIGFMGIPF